MSDQATINTNPASTRSTASAALVEGPVERTLFLFSLPILASNVLQSLNTSINAAWIGHMIGPLALAASANANALLFFLISLGFGIALAATILVGQSLGARNTAEVKRVMGTSYLFFGGLSVAIAAIGFSLAPQLMHAMNTPPNAAMLASAYLRIIFLAIPAIFISTFLMMALRGAGDSRTPFYFMLLSAILDVGLNPLFIAGLGPFPRLGIAGSALATAIAQWLTLFLLLFWLRAKRHILWVGWADRSVFRGDRAILRSLLVKGVPMGLQVIVVSSSMIAMISLVDRFGATTVAAYGACFQLWSYIQMPGFSVGSAVSSMAAQNIGAKRWDRVNRVTAAGVVYSILLTSTLVLFIALLDKQALALFLGQDEAAITVAEHMNLVASWSFILFGIAFVLTSVVRAAGAVVPPLLILITAFWAVRIPFAIFMSSLGVDGVLLGFPAGSFASVLMTALYYRFGDWRAARMLARVEVPANS